MVKTLVEKKTGSKFRLEVTAGEFKDSEIVVMLGENGTGKTTFIKMLAGLLLSDDEEKGHRMIEKLKKQKEEGGDRRCDCNYMKHEPCAHPRWSSRSGRGFLSASGPFFRCLRRREWTLAAV